MVLSVPGTMARTAVSRSSKSVCTSEKDFRFVVETGSLGPMAVKRTFQMSLERIVVVVEGEIVFRRGIRFG